MRKNATREVTSADLALARKLRSELDSEERATTTSRTMAQAIVNARWAVQDNLRSYLEDEAAKGESWAIAKLATLNAGN